MEYTVIIDWSTDKLAKLVNEQIKQGWEPLGGVAIVAVPGDEDGECDLLYAQSMIKKTPANPVEYWRGPVSETRP